MLKMSPNDNVSHFKAHYPKPTKAVLSEMKNRES